MLFTGSRPITGKGHKQEESGLRGGAVGISLALHPSPCPTGIGRLLTLSPASTQASMLLCCSLLLDSTLRTLMSSGSLVSPNPHPGPPQQGLKEGRENTRLELGLSLSPLDLFCLKPHVVLIAVLGPQEPLNPQLLLIPHLCSFHILLFPNPHRCLSSYSHLRSCHTYIFTHICVTAHMYIVAHTWALSTPATTLIRAHAPLSQA